jgi:enediyne biosynthesis protein CalE5
VPDIAEYAAQQRANWNAISAGWAAWQDRFETAARPVTQRLLQLAPVRPGATVLDVGTGTGEPALSAAVAVGAGGRVVATDVADRMLDVARRRAAGVTNVEFLEADAASLPMPHRPYDVVLSRFCLMLVADPAAVLRRLGAMLAPGGALAAAVWTGSARNPLIGLGFQTIAHRLGLAPSAPGAPGPFSLADPGRFTRLLHDAGFTDVLFDRVPIELRLDGAADYVEFTRAVTPPGLLARIPEDELRQMLTGAVEAFADRTGAVRLRGEALCVRATPRADREPHRGRDD